MSDELDALDETILDVASKPAEVSGDLGTVKHKSLKELSDIRREIASREQGSSPIFQKLRPPGMV